MRGSTLGAVSRCRRNDLIRSHSARNRSLGSLQRFWSNLKNANIIPRSMSARPPSGGSRISTHLGFGSPEMERRLSLVRLRIDHARRQVSDLSAIP